MPPLNLHGYSDTALQLQAKAIMERDLSRIRHQRAERKRLSAPIKPTSPPKQPFVPNETGMIPPTTKEPQEAPPNQGEKARLDKDVVMSDVVNLQNTQSSAAVELDSTLKADGKDHAMTSLEGMPQDSQNTTGLAISMPRDPILKDSELANDSVGTSTNLDMNVNLVGNGNAPSDQAKNIGDFDFESMFNDPNLMPQNGTMDLDFDFSPNDAGTQNLLGDNSLEGIVLSNEDLTKAIPATNEDLDSLLPGLDSYVNASGEPAANSAATNANPPASDIVQASQDPNGTSTAAPALGEQPHGESNFGDFYNPADFNTGGITQSNNNDIHNNNQSNDNTLGGGQLGDFEEFSDDWFTNM